MKYVYKLIQDGMEVARVEGFTDEKARVVINHYAIIYGQDGPVEIVKVKQRKKKVVR